MSGTSTIAEVVHEVPREGDIMLLCSDGLAGPVTDEDILDIILAESDLRQATQDLIDKANRNGGPDNVTCVLARWVA